MLSGCDDEPVDGPNAVHSVNPGDSLSYVTKNRG